MAKKDPLDPIFEDLRKLIAFMFENASKPINPDIAPEIQNRLQALQQVVEKLKEKSEKALQIAGLESPLPPEKMKEKLAQMPVKDRRAVEQSFSLGQELSKLYIGFLTARKQAYENEIKRKEVVKPPKKKEAIKRKTKFRKLKGDETWKKL